MSFNECTAFLRSLVDSILSPFASKHHASAELVAAERKFTRDELQDIKITFSSVVRGEREACADRTQLMEMLHLKGLDEHLADRLYRVLKGDSGGVTYEKLLIRMASVVKGAPEGTTRFAYELLANAKNADSLEQELERGLRSLISWATGRDQGGALSQALARGATVSTDGQGSRIPEDFMKWCKGVPAVSAVAQSLLCLQGRPASSAPSKVPHPMYHRPKLLFSSSATHTASLEDSLMDEALIWLLSSWVPADEAEVWELLFNGQVNGASFNTFMGKAAEKGPALVLVRDKKGHLFGGYAADGWAKHGQFYGSALSFIFGLAPAVVRFRASGANQNMLWCGQGFSQLPNGIGWGGKAGYFGLYVDSTFEQGMSRPCSTYNSTCLAADEVFDVDVVECWLLKQPEEPPPKASMGGSSSVLDKFKEDRHLMDLAGRTTQASAGVREARPEDDL